VYTEECCSLPEREREREREESPSGERSDGGSSEGYKPVVNCAKRVFLVL